MYSIFPIDYSISSNVALYNNISHLPITYILVVYRKYSNMHNTFSESRNISMYVSWTTIYIGNDNSNTYLCLFGRIHFNIYLMIVITRVFKNVLYFIIWFWGPVPIFLMIGNTEQVFLHHRSHRTVFVCCSSESLLI